MAYAQQQIPGDKAHAASLAASALEEGHEYGAVFTRRWVVELILDLAGYNGERDLAALRAIEPACGSGSFSRSDCSAALTFLSSAWEGDL